MIVYVYFVFSVLLFTISNPSKIVFNGKRANRGMSQLLDDDCILCEFPNEGNSISVGYTRWIHNYEKVGDYIKSQELVRIKWPSKCDVKPPPKMFNEKEFEWIKTTAIIRNRGGWKEMRYELKILENKGVLPSSKKERRIIAKKEASDHTDEYGQQTSSRLEKRKRAEVVKNVKIKKKKVFLELLEANKLANANSTTGSNNEIEATTSTNDNAEIKQTTSIEDVASINTTEGNTDSFPIKNPADNQDMKGPSAYESNSECTISSDFSSDDVLSEVDEDDDSASTMIIAKLKIENKKLKKKNKDLKTIIKSEQYSVKILKNLELMYQFTKTKMPNKNKETLSPPPILYSIKNTEIEDEKLFRRCSTGSIKRFVGEALEKFYSKEELGTATLSGGVAKCYRNDPTKIAKKKLDPKIVERINSYVKEEFKDDFTEVEIQKAFTRAITEKCNNCSKLLH